MSETSLEERCLFNPAFMAVLTRDATLAYETERGEPLHVVLPYLLLPLALHRPTRKALPSMKTALMQRWIQGNPVLALGLASRCQGLRPFVSSGLRAGLASGALVPTDHGISAGQIRRKPRGLEFTDDFDECRKTSRFLGRWFGGQEDAATSLAMWRVRP